MHNEKIVVLNGFTRGGTNVTWNLMQSHPSVCSPMLETGEILFRGGRLARALRRRKLTRALQVASPRARQMAMAVQESLHERKLTNYGDADNGEKYEGQPYTREEVAASVLCVKSLDRDVALTEFFAAHYPEAYFVGIVRNGYALCNGWMRRGLSARAAGLRFAKIGGRMLADSKRFERYRIVTFEDILDRPMAMAEELYRFAELDPPSVPKLRLKSKRVLTADGEHDTRFGSEGRKSWLDAEALRSALAAGVTQTQADQLSPSDRRAFEGAAGSVLAAFGYA